MTQPARPDPNTNRIRRLVEELADEGYVVPGDPATRQLVHAELDYALHPSVHERRVPSFGSAVAPTTDPWSWDEPTQLQINRRPLGAFSVAAARRFADGLSSWLIRMDDGSDELAVFDRPAGSERDLVVLAEAMDATIVQRHPSGVVRVVGALGVLRWDGLNWHHEPPVSAWIDSVAACGDHGDRAVITRLLEFAVHDLGARGIGAIFVYRPDLDREPSYEVRLPVPPPLRIDVPADLAPLRHVLGQVDGAAVLDATGTLRQLGVRLVPSAEAESDVAGFRGMRHTSGRRYSFDDSTATVIVVSEDGPVTVLRNGELLGRSETLGAAEADDAAEAALIREAPRDFLES